MGGPDARARGARVATQGDVGQGEGERGRDVIEGYVWGYARGRGRDGPWLALHVPLSLWLGLPVIVAARANHVIGPEEDGGIWVHMYILCIVLLRDRSPSFGACRSGDFEWPQSLRWQISDGNRADLTPDELRMFFCQYLDLDFLNKLD